MAGEPRAWLRVRSAENLDEDVVLSRTPFTVGRVGCALNLADGSVSRRHCDLLRTPAGWSVKDQGSSNGTFVNGERIAEHSLNDGDRLRFGKTEAVFRIVAAEAAAAGKAAEPGEPAAGGVGTDTALWNIVELSVGAAEEARWLAGYLESLLKRFGADRGVVVGYEPLTGSLTPLTSLAMTYDEERPDGQVPLSRTIVDQAIREKRTVTTANAEVDPRFREAASVAQYDISAVLCAPARWQGTPLGAVYLERETGKAMFTEAEAQHLQDLSDLLGVAMMAWRAHGRAHGEWERELLLRSFSPKTVEAIEQEGGVGAVRREVRDVTSVVVHASKLEEMNEGTGEEAWRLMSQLLASVTAQHHQRGGAILGLGAALYGARRAEGGAATEDAMAAVQAAVEIQKAARLVVKRIARDFKLAASVGVGVASGSALIGYFGSGQRVDFQGLGEVMPNAFGLAFHAHDGEILMDETTYNRVRLQVNTHRVAPVSLPGVSRQTQPFRVVSF